MIAGINKLAFVTYGTGWGERMVIDGSGNVGIGTTNPETSLTIENASGGAASTTYSTTAANANLHLSAIGVPYYNHLFMGIGSATYAWIQSQHGNSIAQNLALNPIGGNVGIGTTSPQQKLDVIGRVRASYNTSNYYEIGASSAGGFVVGKSGGVETVNIRTYGDSHFNGGNVGIGTTSPGAKLHISTGATYEVGSLSGSILIEPTGVAFDGYGAGIVLGAGRGGRAS